jgi:peptidoglycan/LPS O-acetylase OafA/YrhL
MRAADRAALAFGVASLISVVFTAASGDPWELVRMPGRAVVIAVVLGLAAIAAGALRSGKAAMAVGGAFLAAAALVPIEQALGEKWIEGTGSTFALWLGLCVGLLAAGLAPRDDGKEDHES